METNIEEPTLEQIDEVFRKQREDRKKYNRCSGTGFKINTLVITGWDEEGNEIYETANG